MILLRWVPTVGRHNARGVRLLLGHWCLRESADQRSAPTEGGFQA